MQAYIKELGKDPIVLDMIKEYVKAYPNIDPYFAVPGMHDTQKWLQAVKNIYYGEKNGIPRNKILRQITSNWNVTEVYDFLYWLRFYEEGAHLKYKTAQFYYGNADVGYLLPLKQDETIKENTVNNNSVDFARNSIADEMPIAEKKRIIEKQRSKIIGRLDSAEKLISSPEGQLFSGKELTSLLEAIHDLKRKVHMLNKLSVSSRSYDDMIVREANILNRKGFIKAAEILYSLAADGIPEPVSPDPPTQGSGAPGGLPATVPGVPQVAQTNNNPSIESLSPGIEAFLEALETSNVTTLEDKNHSEDLEVEESDDNLVVEAQANIPEDLEVEEPKEVPKKIDDKEPIEVSENNIVPKQKDFESLLGAAFSDLSVSDIIAELEDIVNFYKTREMPRRLSFVDIMMDKLNIASYFTELSEATNKSLESNNYILTRIESVLGKLRGSIKVEKHFEDTKLPATPESIKLQEALKQQEKAELEKKQIRKNIEEQSLKEQMKESPEIEINKDLEAPVVEKPITAPVPAPKPVVPVSAPAPVPIK